MTASSALHRTITQGTPRTRRGVELLLLAFALAIVMLAYANVGLAIQGRLPPDLLTLGIGFGVVALALHLLVRWQAAYADPVLLPVATLLNGLGLVMIHRLDLAKGKDLADGAAVRQLFWTGISVLAAGALLVIVRDHRRLGQYIYTFALVGLGLLLLPLTPILGRNVNGSRIWIGVGPLSFQPSELAKIAVIIFFAGYLVQKRDALSLVGRRILGFPLPRARDLGPIILAWLASLAVLVFESDLGTSLLFFGLFVSLLYVATERRSWIIIGLTLFMAGCYAAYLLFAHFRVRVDLWINPFNTGLSDQLALGLMGMGSGGMLGTGLGQGRPDLTYFANSDFIVPSFGEELGLVGLIAIIMLYAILVERGLRAGIAARDGFGKLLATGLGFSIALQVFVVIGGVTRVIPLTGLTTPFMSAGGSSLFANWIIVILLMRISDQARRPTPEDSGPSQIGSADTQALRLR